MNAYLVVLCPVMTTTMATIHRTISRGHNQLAQQGDAMGLVIKCGELWDQTKRANVPPTLLIQLSQLAERAERSVIVYGYARRRDAEIAKHVLETQTPIDWDADEETIRRQWNEFGGREAVRKLIAEHLQW